MKINLAKYLPTSFIILVILIINLYNWQSFWIGLIFGLSFLALHGYALGKMIFPEENIAIKIIYGILFLIAAISLLGAIFYYLYKLDTVMVSLEIIIITIAIPFIVAKYNERMARPTPFPPPASGREKEAHGETPSPLPGLTVRTVKCWAELVLIIIYLIITAYTFFILFTHQTTESIRSPWEVLPKEFFIFYFLASFILIGLIIKIKQSWISIVLISLHTFLSTSIALIVYKIGYGFDPFIHEAAEKIIGQTGVILPKTFYYIGQYSLLTFLSKLLQINAVWLDKIIVPLLFSVYLPFSIFYALTKLGLEKRKTILLGLVSLIIPFSGFIVTTPQSLANFFVILTILFALAGFNPWLLILLASTTVLIHPLSGLSIIIFLILRKILLIKKEPQKILKIAIPLMSVIILSFAIPLVFMLLAKISTTASSILNLESPLIPQIQFLNLKTQFNPILDLAYLYGFNWITFYLIISFIGLAILIYKKQIKNYLSYLLAFVALLLNYLILKILISFPFLIKYEQGNYPDRLFEISLYFLLPFFFYTLYYFIVKIESYFQKEPVKLYKYSILIFFLIINASLLTASFHISYPRADLYDPSRGWSTSQTDINAVRCIQNKAANNNYIVLADQSVSAAAIQEFGFKKYYKNDIFYYPIPTGDPLYQLYLDMVYKKPTKETMLRAMDLAGVNEAYFVLNDYWWQSAKIREEATATAESFEKIDDEKIFVFKYVR
jgi:hypothetical protein